MSSRRVLRFPQGFLWGAATASHQVEGGNRWNDWWQAEQSGRVPHASGEACDHYRRFASDFDLARSLGHNAHRFSLEWSRIEPRAGEWNGDAIAHYRDVIRALRHRGLEPIVTLHHFTNPAWFAERGGWTRSDSVKLFARYVRRVAEDFGAEVRYWLTINEPVVYVTQGYLTGEWPPGRRRDWFRAAVAFVNLARAHVAAYRVLHDAAREARVGFAHSAVLVVPCDPHRRRDRLAARLRDFALNGAFFYLIGARAQSASGAAANLDFVGVNYYTRAIIRGAGRGPLAIFGQVCKQPHHERGPMSEVGWEVYPQGLAAVLERFARLGLPLMITENGVATEDEDLRRDFIRRHLEVLGESIEAGVDVRGYLHWTLLDNFEWALGTAARYGLAAVDYATQERKPRPAALDFARVCRDNRLEVLSSNERR